MSRFSSNCSVTEVAPRLLVEVISVTPAMRLNWRSSGVATAEAIVSGLAPGKFANTLMVGKSTWGRGATGKKRNAPAPASRIAKEISDVATGLRMKGPEKLELKFKRPRPSDPILDDADGRKRVAILLTGDQRNPMIGRGLVGM